MEKKNRNNFHNFQREIKNLRNICKKDHIWILWKIHKAEQEKIESLVDSLSPFPRCTL